MSTNVLPSVISLITEGASHTFTRNKFFARVKTSCAIDAEIRPSHKITKVDFNSDHVFFLQSA